MKEEEEMKNCILLVACLTALKVLLIPCTYYSTDLLVHRNWMAITKNTPAYV